MLLDSFSYLSADIWSKQTQKLKLTTYVEFYYHCNENIDLNKSIYFKNFIMYKIELN